MKRMAGELPVLASEALPGSCQEDCASLTHEISVFKRDKSLCEIPVPAPTPQGSFPVKTRKAKFELWWKGRSQDRSFSGEIQQFSVTDRLWWGYSIPEMQDITPLPLTLPSLQREALSGADFCFLSMCS